MTIEIDTVVAAIEVEFANDDMTITDDGYTIRISRMLSGGRYDLVAEVDYDEDDAEASIRSYKRRSWAEGKIMSCLAKIDVTVE